MVGFGSKRKAELIDMDRADNLFEKEIDELNGKLGPSDQKLLDGNQELLAFSRTIFRMGYVSGSRDAVVKVIGGLSGDIDIELEGAGK